MKSVWLGVIVLLISPSLAAQDLEDLRRQLASKEAEIQQLQQRIKVLEREVTPARIERARTGRVVNEQDNEGSNRALERALVRERGLLLPPSSFELEANFVYSHRVDNASNFRRDSYGPGLAFRAGLPWRSQLEVALPYVFERRRNGVDSTDSHGIGDFTIGLSHQLLLERPLVPSLIGAIHYQASTGRNTVFESATPVARGSGFDAIQASLTTVKRIDPLVLFSSYSFAHNFSENKNGVKVAPGNSHGLRFGSALATGPDTSLRAAFNVTYFDKTNFGGRLLPGTDDPVGLFEFGGSVSLTGSTALDVLVGIGVTRSAPDFRITAALPIRF